MALNLVRAVLDEKLETIGKEYFIGYVPIGSLARGTSTKRSDKDVMVLTTPENFKRASHKLSYVFDQVNDHYFRDVPNNIDVTLSPPARTKKYSLEPQAVTGLGGEVFCDWKPVPLQEALRISSIARSPLHVLWYKEVNLSNKNPEIIKLKDFLGNVHVDLGGFQTEILTHLCGDFENVIERVAGGEPINHDFHGRTIEELKEYPRFIDDLMIITDPVDGNRNAFGKIRKNTKFVWDKVVFSSANFLDTGEVTPKPLPSGYNYVIVYDVSRFPDDETKFSKLFGVGNKCKGLLKSKRYETDIVDIRESEGLVFLNLSDISRTFWHMGPELKHAENYKIFLEKNRGRELRKKDGRVYAKRERPSVEKILSENDFEVQQMIKV